MEDMLAAIEGYLREQTHILIDRLAFDGRVQLEGEKFGAFLADLRQLYITSQGCLHCRDVRLHTRIVSGLFSQKLKQKTAYEISACLVGSEMCIRDSPGGGHIRGKVCQVAEAVDVLLPPKRD